MTEINFTPFIVLGYLFGLFIIAIISFIALGILSKHAENKSVARAVSIVYGILFILITLTSLSTFIP